MTPWVQTSAQHKPGLVMHIGNPRKWRQEDRKFKVILCYVAHLRPTWAIEDPTTAVPNNRMVLGTETPLSSKITAMSVMKWKYVYGWGFLRPPEMRFPIVMTHGLRTAALFFFFNSMFQSWSVSHTPAAEHVPSLWGLGMRCSAQQGSTYILDVLAQTWNPGTWGDWGKGAISSSHTVSSKSV